MIFPELKARCRERFLEVSTFLGFISNLEPSPEAIEPTSIEVKVLRGLFYVHLYSAMERTINDISETSLNYVSGKEIKFVDYTSPLLALALQDQIRSLRNCSATKVLQKSIDLFSIANSQEVSIISNTSLATALQNTWGATINELLQVFGISSQPISGRERSTIDEVVDKRNAVAHGRDSAAAVGERFRCSDLRMRYDVVYDLMARLVDMFDEYCSNKEFVTTEIRSTYA